MNFKKIKVAVVAAATALATFASLPITNVSAEYNYDVNGDGRVTTADASAISRYLIGNLYEPNYNKFDVNNSLTIDNMDVQCILAEIMGYNYDSDYYSRETHAYTNAPTVSSFIPNFAANSTASRSYKRYSYTNNTELTNYLLSPSLDQLSTQNTNSRILIGTKDFYLAKGSENCGLVRITGSISGTGFVVDDHHIATAAHCVYGNDWYENLTVSTYNENGTLSGEQLTPVEAHFPSLYLTTSRDVAYDYALITVEEDLSDYVHFDLGTSYTVNEESFEDIPVYVTGCHQFNNPSHLLYSAEGRIIRIANASKLNYTVDTVSGDSGAPVYTITRNIVNNQPSYTYTALAIHSGADSSSADSNRGSAITKYHFQFYKNNSYANY